MSLDFDPNRLEIPAGHHIGGRLLELGGQEIPVLRPSDHQLMGSIRDGGVAAVDRAVEAARKALAQSRWSRVSPRERGRVLRRWAELIESCGGSLAQLEAAGSTRPISETVGRDLPRTAEVIRYYGEFCDKLEGDITATEAGVLSLVKPEPYGIVGAVVPWNFPLITAAWKFAPALAAGNAMVMKTSELTPFSLLALAELAAAAGLPAGLFNVVNGLGPTTGMAIIRHPEIRKISFTGSSATGGRIMAAAAEAGVKPVTLELGGKSPQLIFDDAGDLDNVAGHIARGFLGNAGQVCTAGTRLIVQSSIADRLLERVEAQCNAVIAGPTWEERTSFSPIVSARQADRLEDLVRRTLAEGAVLRRGGRRLEARNAGAWYAPTILEGVTDSMTGFREEFFGPVLSVTRFETPEEGIALADHPLYGLAASVYTADIRKALKAADSIEAGMVWVNHHGRAPEFTFPAGGFKGSGFGKDMGRAGIEGYLRQKAVWVSYA
jgi:aldehyde dehydrogenase (NAD+)